MAEGGGVEPPLPDPESGVLPLDDPSTFPFLIKTLLLFYNIFLIGQTIMIKSEIFFLNYIFFFSLSANFFITLSRRIILFSFPSTSIMANRLGPTVLPESATLTG